MRSKASLCILALGLLVLMASCESVNITEIKVHENIIQTRTIISAGSQEGFAIHPDGSLWAWGSNDFGQLGDGTTTNRYTPVKIMDDVASVSSDRGRTTAITSDGSLWVWGVSQGLGSEPTPVKIMDDVVSVSLGSTDIIAIRTDGSLWRISSLSPLVSRKIMEDVVYASAGTNHVLAIRTDGSLWAWGNNGQGEVGDGTTEYRHRLNPVKIMEDVVAISASSHSMAIRSDGTLWAWGNNWSGQLGDGTTVNRYAPVKIMDNVVAISAGHSHSMAIRNDGSLWGWGSNWYGQLGDGTAADPSTSPGVIRWDNGWYRMSSNGVAIQARHTPTKIMEDVVAVSASSFTMVFGTGAAHTLAVRTDGTLWAWGSNSSGQLGDGTTENRLYPIMIHDGILIP